MLYISFFTEKTFEKTILQSNRFNQMSNGLV